MVHQTAGTRQVTARSRAGAPMGGRRDAGRRTRWLAESAGHHPLARSAWCRLRARAGASRRSTSVRAADLSETSGPRFGSHEGVRKGWSSGSLRPSDWPPFSAHSCARETAHGVGLRSLHALLDEEPPAQRRRCASSHALNAISRCCHQSTPAHPQVHSATGPMVGPRSWPARNFRAFLRVVMWSSMSPLPRHPLSRPALWRARAEAPKKSFERDDRRTPGRHQAKRSRLPQRTISRCRAVGSVCPRPERWCGNPLPGCASPTAGCGASCARPAGARSRPSRARCARGTPLGPPTPTHPSGRAARSRRSRAGISEGRLWRGPGWRTGGAADAIWPSPGRADQASVRDHRLWRPASAPATLACAGPCPPGSRRSRPVRGGDENWDRRTGPARLGERGVGDTRS